MVTYIHPYRPDRTPAQRRNDYLEDCIEAHDETVREWRENRPEDLEELEERDQRHVGDALFKPASYSCELVEEFYTEIAERI